MQEVLFKIGNLKTPYREIENLYKPIFKTCLKRTFTVGEIESVCYDMFLFLAKRYYADRSTLNIYVFQKLVQECDKTKKYKAMAKINVLKDLYKHFIASNEICETFPLVAVTQPVFITALKQLQTIYEKHKSKSKIATLLLVEIAYAIMKANANIVRQCEEENITCTTFQISKGKIIVL